MQLIPYKLTRHLHFHFHLNSHWQQRTFHSTISPMGGKAFATIQTESGQPPQVPRMPPDTYQKVAAECQEKLQRLFKHVTIPRDAPAKLDYGDIDFLVEGIRPTEPRHHNLWLAVKNELGAELHIPRRGSQSFGIRHPMTPDAYIQVDVELSPGNDTPNGAELFEWTRFMKGDSDLLQIVGVCHRPLGLTCNDEGLHVRVQEIEPYNKKQALLFLTRDPDTAMQFYGFDTAKYWQGFETEAEIFDWVSQGRFFSHEVFEARQEKSNDRSRQQKRPMYRRFVEEYMSGLPKKEPSQWTREQVLKEALTKFNKHDEYQKMMDEHNQKEAEEALWADIREAIPLEDASLGRVLKGLKRFVSFQDGRPYITSEPVKQYSMWTKAVPPKGRKNLVAWVQWHWQEVKPLEKERVSAAKEERRKAVREAVWDEEKPELN